MKPEYVEAKNETNSPNMFSKLHPHHHHNPFPHHFQEDDSPASGGAVTPTKPREGQITGDGATIEVIKRPRGRPPGSKNKPKPPVVITHDPEQPVMSPYILEVATGQDIVESISCFCRHKNTGLCVLSGSGTVANVTLKQPSSTPGATVTFHGRLDILSISATFLAPFTTCCGVPNGFTISLSGPQGQIVGGLVVGPLMAAGTVCLVAASFNNPSFHRLPLEDEMHGGAVSGSGGGDGNSPPVSDGGESGHPSAAESCGMSRYSCHLPSDVIWAPAASRQQQPPPY